MKTITENLLTLNKYGINSFAEITDHILNKNYLIEQNNLKLEEYKQELKNIKAKRFIDPDADKKIFEITIKINDIYNDNKFINNEIKVLEKIKKNSNKFMNLDYIKEKEFMKEEMNYEKQ